MSYRPISRKRALAIEEHLGTLLDPLVQSGALSDDQLGRLAAEAYRFVADCLRVGHVFFKGFEALKTGNLAPSDPGDQHVQWTREAESNMRSGRIVANMLAFEFCAMLDETLPRFIEHGKKGSSVFREAWKNLGGSQIVVRPTGKKVADWPETVLDLFSVSRDALVVEGLRDMLGARNCAAHELPHLGVEVWGEHVSMWGKASIWLLSSLAHSLDPLLPPDKPIRR